MKNISVKDSESAASLMRSELFDRDKTMAKILVVGSQGCGKTWAYVEACRGSPFLKWDISSGPPTMVGSSGLSRFFGPAQVPETIVIDDVDSALAAESNVRSPGVAALLAIVADPMRPVILTSTAEDPFKVLGTSAAGKAIQAALTLCLIIREEDAPKTKTKTKTKTVGGLDDRHMLYVLLLEAAAGCHSNDALSSTATNMRQYIEKNWLDLTDS